MRRGHDAAIFTMLCLILLTLWFQKTFKLIFLNQSSCWTLEKTNMELKLKWNCFFSTFTPVLCEHVTTSSTSYHGKCVLIYKLKDFRWWNFDTQFECTGVFISKVTIFRSTHLINIYSFWNCLSKNLLLIG